MGGLFSQWDINLMTHRGRGQGQMSPQLAAQEAAKQREQQLYAQPTDPTVAGYNVSEYLPPHLRPTWRAMGLLGQTLAPTATKEAVEQGTSPTVGLLTDTLGSMPMGKGLLAMAAVPKATKGLADRMADYLRKMGAYVESDASKISESKYLYARFPKTGENEPSTKIRISNHESPSKYADADFEISGTGAGGAWGMDEGIEAIARRHGLEVPADVTNRLAKERQLSQQLEARNLQATQDAAAKVSTEATRAQAMFPDEWKASLDLAGPDRREAQRILRRRATDKP